MVRRATSLAGNCACCSQGACPRPAPTRQPAGRKQSACLARHRPGHSLAAGSAAVPKRSSPLVVMAAATPSAAPISRAITFTPRPPSNGTTALPSSATASTGGSLPFSPSRGARLRMTIPAAHSAMIGVACWYSARRVSPKALCSSRRPPPGPAGHGSKACG